METFRLLYIAIGPGIAMAVYIYYADRWEPEPKRLVIKSFLLGGLACFPTGYFEEAFLNVFELNAIFWEGGFDSSLWEIVFYAFFGVALAEEVCKFLFLKGFIYDDREFNEPFDGIVYGGMIGCGFATMENIFYVFENGHETGILRMLTTIPAHAFNGIILGYFLGKAKFSNKPKKHLFRGLGVVILLHGAYDSVAFSNFTWAIYAIFAIVALGIYLGLKAKRSLEKLSEEIETSSMMEFFLLKDGKKQGPFTLSDIRDSLSGGRMELEDVLIDKEGEETKSARELLRSGTGSKYCEWVKPPPQGKPLKTIFLFYGLTFGLYLYFWFLGNYRDFKNYKHLNINPELRALGLFVLTTVPNFIFGTILNIFGKYGDPFIEIPFNLLMAGIGTTFLFFQLQMIKGFLKEKLKDPFSVFTIAFFFFVLSSARRTLNPNSLYYWAYEIILILLQGGVLAVVQRDLNIFWKYKNGQSDCSPSKAESA